MKNPKSYRTLIAGIFSVIFLLATIILNAMSFLYYPENKSSSMNFIFYGNIYLLFSFIFALIGIIKANKTKIGKVLCITGIVYSSISFLFFITAMISVRAHKTYTREYLLDIEHKKIEYVVTDGLFNYNRFDIYNGNGIKGTENKFYYNIQKNDSNDDDSFPCCNWLYFNDEFRMIGLSEFCKFYGIYYKEDIGNKRTFVDSYILDWGKYKARIESSDETINLNYPVVFRRAEASGKMDTFVDLDFLYYAGYLNLYDKERCWVFYNDLYEKARLIYKNGIENEDGNIYYKGNYASGARCHFCNNELFDEGQSVNIGDVQAIVPQHFGVPLYPMKKTSEYPGFDVLYDEKGLTVKSISVDLEYKSIAEGLNN